MDWDESRYPDWAQDERPRQSKPAPPAAAERRYPGWVLDDGPRRRVPWPPLAAWLRRGGHAVVTCTRTRPVAWLAGIAGSAAVVVGVEEICTTPVQARLAATGAATMLACSAGVVTLALAAVQRRLGAPRAAEALGWGLAQLAALVPVALAIGLVTR